MRYSVPAVDSCQAMELRKDLSTLSNCLEPRKGCDFNRVVIKRGSVKERQEVSLDQIGASKRAVSLA